MATVDRIEILDKGAKKTLNVDQWKALPLVERVSLLRGDISFFAGGQPVPSKDAIKQLR